MNFLSVRGLTKRYGAVTALDAVDVTVASGSRTAIVGPSGSGKTTLLRIIGGFETADAGSVSLDGVALVEDARAVPAYRRNIGFVPQDGALFPHLSIGENIGFGLPRDMPGRDGQIAALMELVDLDRRMLTRRPHELSGGQQQRVAVARALARKPKLILLDEPFSALDTGLRDMVRKSVVGILRSVGTAAILVTHDQSEAMSFADQLCVMLDGRLVQSGAPHDLYFRPSDARIAGFLGNAVVLTAQIADGWAFCRLGRIRVDRPNLRGAASIMLRPEQIRMAETNAATAPADGIRASVVDVEFGGSISVVSVRLAQAGAPGCGATPPGPGAGGTIQIPNNLAVPPPPGTTVTISVAGVAHVFDDQVAR